MDRRTLLTLLAILLMYLIASEMTYQDEVAATAAGSHQGYEAPSALSTELRPGSLSTPTD